MKIAAQIRNTIENLPEDKVFGYADLGIGQAAYQTAAKALERLQKDGTIKKMSKGFFYKPVQTIFGEMSPDYFEQLKPYLYKNGKRIAYITGAFLYNQMNLTTQMAFRIKIAGNKRINIDRAAIKAKSVKSYAAVSDANFELLGYLDAIKDIRRIPDCSAAKAVKILSNKIEKFDNEQIEEMVGYALLYPPRVRALLGAILENINTIVNIQKLKDSLNPLTKFTIGLKASDLPTIKNWNIE